MFESAKKIPLYKVGKIHLIFLAGKISIAYRTIYRVANLLTSHFFCALKRST